MQHNLVRMIRGHPTVTLTPIIADRVRKDRAIAVERGACHRARRWVESLETSTRIFIPEVDCTVGAF